ncbi:MAG: PEP-CTERM sorting domain-containing protein [Planctomycetaceae bacterium]|nr:PEP-CTERM sorting domain-containing protein [Planctomycetaceae bacterium]
MKSLKLALIVFCVFGLITPNLSVAQHGADGADGARWQFGGNGGDGTDFVSIRPTVGAPFSWMVQGFNGGRGGRGGEGFIWNAKPEDSAIGMPGGWGGRGGDLSAIWEPLLRLGVDGPIYQQSVFVEARAGHGGAGGLGGNGFQGGRVGDAGRGGNGGSAHAIAHGGLDVTSRAIGGMGGTANGYGGRGGDGGNASAEAEVTNPQHYVRATTNIWMNAIGGRGGNGFDQALGGNGGTSNLGDTANNYQILANGSQLPLLNLDIVGRGGDGGNSFGSHGGTGGDSRIQVASMLTANRYVSRNAGTQYPGPITSATFKLFGGRGGDGLAHSRVTGHGGGGGSVIVDTQGEASAAQKLTIIARGGRGGDALGSFGGSGGLGGEVSMGTLTLVGGEVDIFLRGGDGGHSTSGHAGAGRTVESLMPKYNGVGTPSHYKFTVQGGDGGNLLGSTFSFQGVHRLAGNGGDAVINSFSQNAYLSHGNNEVRAIGGMAGRGISAGGIERAGRALVSFRQTVMSAGSLTAIAEGGLSHQRTNGYARAILDLQAADGVDGAITGSATARPAQHGSGPGPLPVASFAGSAHAESFVLRRNGSGLITSIANSDGGFGTVQSGSSRAKATAVNSTMASTGVPRGREAYASATALARADGSLHSANHAISSATAVSNKAGEAFAVSRALGQYNYGNARAEIRAPKGIAKATAEGETTQWIHRSKVSSSAFSHATTNQPLILTSSAYTSFRHTHIEISTAPFENFAPSAWNHLLINPGQTAVDNFTNSNMFIDQAFDFGSRSTQVGNILAIGKTGGGQSLTDLVNGDFQATNEFDLTLHLHPAVQGSEELSLAFFNPVAYRDGFESLTVKFDYQGVNVLHEEFTDMATAKAFFTNRIVSLDSLVATEGLERHFSLQYDMRFSSTGDVFGFDFLIGSRNQVASFAAFSSVPEPTMVPIMIGAAMAMLLRRRRQV